MPEEITDSERSELQAEARDSKRTKKEMTLEEILECPTWDCDGGPDVWSTGVRTGAGEIWCVGCPKCRGWISQFLVNGEQDPYTIGIGIWEDMRKSMGK